MTADVVSVPVIGACAAPDEMLLLYPPRLPLCTHTHTRRYHCYATWELNTGLLGRAAVRERIIRYHGFGLASRCVQPERCGVA